VSEQSPRPPRGGPQAAPAVARAEQGQPGSVHGTLTSPGGAGAVEVAVSPDGRFAFVTLEDSGTMAVFNLQAALASGLRNSGLVDAVRIGINPIRLTVSRDGQWLYVTAQKRDEQAEQGTVSVISVPRAESDPAASIVARALAGCDPGRVITTSGGATVWVTGRATPCSPFPRPGGAATPAGLSSPTSGSGSGRSG
jgi:hypothetical protein